MAHPRRIELRLPARKAGVLTARRWVYKMEESMGFEPMEHLPVPNGFQDRLIKPL